MTVFSPEEHFDGECWKAFNEQLQTLLLMASLDPVQKIVLASVALGECAGSEDKTWDRVTRCRMFLDTSKEAGFCSSPTRKTREFFSEETHADVRRILLVARSQERDLFAKASSTGGFDLDAQGWIVVVINDAPHILSSFPSLKNYIIVPSIKMIEAGAVQLSVIIAGKEFDLALFSLPETSVSNFGKVMGAKLLAGLVASALMLFKGPGLAEPS